MYNLLPKQTLPIIPDSSNAKNFITIIVVIIIMYIIYQVIMLMFNSHKANKLKKLLIKGRELTYQSAKVNGRFNPSQEYESAINAEDRQDDIRTLLRGKK